MNTKNIITLLIAYAIITASLNARGGGGFHGGGGHGGGHSGGNSGGRRGGGCNILK